jgi:Septum formation
MGAVAVLGMAALLLSACGNPAGTDGNLTNNWKAMADAVIPTPKAGSCYNVETDDPASVTKWPVPVECTTTHTVETAYVGAFTGDDANQSSAPSNGSAGRRKAYEQCAAEAKTFLGDDWRAGRLELTVVLPIALHWQGGARWFRCDLMEYKDLNNYEVVKRTASLKGGLSGDRPVGLSCMAITITSDNKVGDMNPVACTTAHNGEFAGVYDLPDGPFPTDPKVRLDGCAPVVAAFANVPNDADLSYRTGWISSPFSEVDWGLGNRGVRCYAHKSTNMTKSIKGVGPAGLPAD